VLFLVALSLIISTVAVDCLQRLVSKLTYYVSCSILNARYCIIWHVSIMPYQQHHYECILLYALPSDITSAPLLAVFGRRLKTELFRCCYNESMNRSDIHHQGALLWRFCDFGAR